MEAKDEREEEEEKEQKERLIQLAKQTEVGKRKRKSYQSRRRIRGERVKAQMQCTEQEAELEQLAKPDEAAAGFASHVLMCRLVPVTWRPMRWCFSCKQTPCRHHKSGSCTRRLCRFCHCPEGSPTVALLYAGSVAEG
ncbi:unnamed protein product [Effrenium voratum]|nr:unnamed protein product [Effrenium voratum]